MAKHTDLDTGLTLDPDPTYIPKRRGMYDDVTEQYDKAEKLLMYLSMSDARVYATNVSYGPCQRWWAEIKLARDITFKESGTNPWEATVATVWKYL